MLGITPLILIILPLLFQLILGIITTNKTIPFRFRTLSIINFILQIVFVIIAFSLASYNFSQYFDENPNSSRCGMPLVGLMALSLLLTVTLIVVIFIQYLIKRWKYKNA